MKSLYVSHFFTDSISIKPSLAIQQLSNQLFFCSLLESFLKKTFFLFYVVKLKQIVNILDRVSKHYGLSPLYYDSCNFSLSQV